MKSTMIAAFCALTLAGCVAEDIQGDSWELDELDADYSEDSEFREAQALEGGEGGDFGEADFEAVDDEGDGCFVGASSGFHTVADEDACTRLCFFDNRKASFWVDGNIHGNCKCVACACSGCDGTCVPVSSTSVFGPDATCECHDSPLGLDGEMVCS